MHCITFLKIGLHRPCCMHVPCYDFVHYGIWSMTHTHTHSAKIFMPPHLGIWLTPLKSYALPLHIPRDEINVLCLGHIFPVQWCQVSCKQQAQFCAIQRQWIMSVSHMFNLMTTIITSVVTYSLLVALHSHCTVEIVQVSWRGSGMVSFEWRDRIRIWNFRGIFLYFICTASFLNIGDAVCKDSVCEVHRHWHL